LHVPTGPNAVIYAPFPITTEFPIDQINQNNLCIFTYARLGGRVYNHDVVHRGEVFVNLQHTIVATD